MYDSPGGFGIDFFGGLGVGVLAMLIVFILVALARHRADESGIDSDPES